MRHPRLKAEQKIGVGVIGNIASFDTGGTETETTGDKESTTASVDETAEFGSLFVEVQTKTDSSMGLTLGLEFIPGSHVLGSQSRTDAESPADRDGDDGTYTGKDIPIDIVWLDRKKHNYSTSKLKDMIWDSTEKHLIKMAHINKERTYD